LNIALDADVQRKLTPNGTYTIQLEVTSFLGMTGSTQYSFTRQASSDTPTATITSSPLARLTEGIVLEADVSRSSVCGSEKVIKAGTLSL